jgi:hypothetical protein
MDDNQNPRVILALAAEEDDEFAWNQLRTLQANMFAAGPISVQFCYFGAEGARQARRPYIATSWATDDGGAECVLHRARVPAPNPSPAIGSGHG